MISFLKHSRIVFFFGIMLASTSFAAPTLNYQGRVTASGTNYTGFGFFKFVILDQSLEGLWSNDGSAGTNEPASAVTVDVNNGLYNIELGDLTEPGMTEEISPLVFHENSLFLRAWFSTNNVTFEQLTPDTTVYPADYAHLNTGNMLVVDDNDRADFNTIQEALDVVSTNFFFDTVLVMPGFYNLTSSLIFPTNRIVYLRGVDRGSVFINNTNGAAALPHDSRIENVTISGNPAIADSGSNVGYTVRRCRLQRASGVGAAVELTANGFPNMFECEIQNDSGGPALLLTNSATLTAAHLTLMVSGGAGPVIDIYNANTLTLEDSDITNTDGDAIEIHNGNGNVNLKKCNVTGSVISQDTFTGLTLTDCSLQGTTNGAYTLQITDIYQPVNVQNCFITMNDNPAVWIEASASISGNMSEVTFYHSRIECATTGGTLDESAIVITNAVSNTNNFPNLSLLGSDVDSQIGDGVQSHNSIVGIKGSRISGTRYATYLSACNSDIANSTIESTGDHGLVVENPELTIHNSNVTGANDAINAQGTGQLHIYFSNIEGGKNATNRAVYAALTDATNGLCSIAQTTVSASGPGFECDGGFFALNSCAIISQSAAPVFLRNNTTEATLNNCFLFSPDAANTNAGLVLYGDGGGIDAPIPYVVSCSIQPSAAASVSIDIAGSVSTGNVQMANTVLRTNLSANVGIVSAATSLPNGSYIP